MTAVFVFMPMKNECTTSPSQETACNIFPVSFSGCLKLQIDNTNALRRRLAYSSSLKSYDILY